MIMRYPPSIDSKAAVEALKNQNTYFGAKVELDNYELLDGW